MTREKLTQFADVIGMPSSVGSILDPQGSSQDRIFADAIVSLEPTSVLEEAGIVTVKQAPAEADEIVFPIVRNTQLTWKEIDARAGSDLGSEYGATPLNVVEYRKVRPTTKTANIFLPETISLMNKTDFELFARIGATDAKRYKESQTLTTLFTQTNHAASNVKVAGGFSAGTGSVNAGSTLDPFDLVKAKKLLSTGSDIYVPDYVLMHPEQYADLNAHDDFAPGATTPGAMMRKAKWNDDGDLVKFEGMDIFVSELVPSSGSPGAGSDISDASYSGQGGHNAVVGTRGRSVARGEHMGIKVTTEVRPLLHGQYKIFDVDFANDILVQESMVLLKCAD